jgi:hypothetical protein
MKMIDIIEGMRPVASVWKRRDNRIERGRISRFDVKMNQLRKIETCHGEKKEGSEEAQCDSVRSNNGPNISPQGAKKR